MTAWALNSAGFGPVTFVLVALVATIAALLIHNRAGRKSAGGQIVSETSSNAETDTNDLAAELPELRARMLEISERMGIPERVLPKIAIPTGADGDFLFRDKFDFVYRSFERGALIAEHSAADPDELFYHVFRDRAWMRAYQGLVGLDLTPDDHAARLAQGQESLLGMADPDWAERARRERGLAAGTGSVQG